MTDIDKKPYCIDMSDVNDDPATFNTVMALSTDLLEVIYRFTQKNGSQMISHVCLALVIAMAVGIDTIDNTEDKFEEVADVIELIRKLTRTVVQ